MSDEPSSSRLVFAPWLTVCALLVIAVIGGFGVTIAAYRAYDLQQCTSHFQLLNPSVRCTKDPPPRHQEYDTLQKTLTWRIDEWKKQGEATQVSVYFRDLRNGPLFGINSQMRFAPASLLKVPILLAVLKYAEDHPGILDETIAVGPTVPEGQNVQDSEKTLLPGHTYPVREVMRRMIEYSDNTSKELLRRRIEELSPGSVDQTFIDLGILLQNADGSQFITVKAYASIFRSLFNASYVSRGASEMALDLLSQTEFTEGIVAGVPAQTTVAHKFGFSDPKDGTQQLQDCGIVYHPHTPYLLCVMARGKDADTDMKIIAAVSRLVFDEVTLRSMTEER